MRQAQRLEDRIRDQLAQDEPNLRADAALRSIADSLARLERRQRFSWRRVFALLVFLLVGLPFLLLVVGALL